MRIYTKCLKNSIKLLSWTYEPSNAIYCKNEPGKGPNQDRTFSVPSPYQVRSTILQFLLRKCRSVLPQSDKIRCSSPRLEANKKRTFYLYAATITAWGDSIFCFKNKTKTIKTFCHAWETIPGTTCDNKITTMSNPLRQRIYRMNKWINGTPFRRSGYIFLRISLLF